MSQPDLDLRNEILDHISANKEIHFKSQQIGDPELTTNEKRNIAESILNNSISLFLSRFGQYLTYEQMKYFKNCPQGDEYTVKFYLDQQKAQKLTKKNVKNRRFEAMKKLISEGSYFSESEMKSRNPLLYEQLIGQYLSPEEKEEANRLDTSNITLVNILLHQIDRDNEESFKQEQLEIEKIESSHEDMSCIDVLAEQPINLMEKDTEVEYDTSDEEDSHTKNTLNRIPKPIVMHEEETLTQSTSLWGEDMSDQPLSKPVGIERTPWATPSVSRLHNQPKSKPSVKLSDSERSLLFQEFRSHMLTTFLEGKEKLFDYSKVDTNPAYDNLDEEGQDAEDKYFDEDESCDSVMEVETKSKENTSSEDELDMFMKNLKPNLLTQDINFKLKKPPF